MPNLPSQLLKSLSHLDHFEENAFVEAHREENKITSIRLNPFKKTVLEFETNGLVPWCESGFYLKERPSFTHDPLFQAGCYYVQEAGSMFIEYALRKTLNFEDSLAVLDLCAAPGGKSTLINSLLNKNSLLVANEIVRSRADVLAQNLGKWGTANSIVTNNEPQRFSELHGFFDALVIDAPCSGSGLFRKQPEAIDEWSPEAVVACSIRQKKILKDVLPSLKENGILIYSTCSYSVEENEEVVQSLMADFGMEYVKLDIDPLWGLVETDFGYRFYPHLTKSEGFFCSVLRKTHEEKEMAGFKKKKINELVKNDKVILENFVRSEGSVLLKKNEHYYLTNTSVQNFLERFEKQFYFKKAGVRIGEIKGKDLVPDQELAWFTDLSPTVNSQELDKETALHFLKKENFVLNTPASGLN